MITESNFTSIKNNSMGNPRYVLHFLKLADNYNEALYIAKQFGGKKFNNRQYGGGIVFSTYSLHSLVEKLNIAIDNKE